MEKFFSRMFAACVAAAAAMASPASAEEVPARFSVVQWNIGNFSMGTNSLTAITDGESAARSAEYRAMIDALKPEFLGISELADGNPKSRVYAYLVEVAGNGERGMGNGRRVLLKAVYAAGCNMGMGHEPNGGVTELVIPKSELPSGETLTITATPFTSLGTRGKPITAKWSRA